VTWEKKGAISVDLLGRCCNGGDSQFIRGGTMAESSGANDDLKAKMREALDRKNQASHPKDSEGGQGKEKAHGPEVVGGAPKMHRRKAGGGGS